MNTNQSSVSNLPDDMDLCEISCFKRMVDNILNGVKYPASEISKLQKSAAYGAISEYFISPTFLDRLDEKLKSGSLEFVRLEQLLFIFLICRRYDMQLCRYYDMNNTFNLAFSKYVDFMRSGSTAENISVLFYSIIFINGNKANEIFDRELFRRFSTQALDIDFNLIDEGIRKHLAGLIMDTTLSRLSSPNVHNGWNYSNNKENLIMTMENLRRLEAESSFEDTISAVTLYYEYIRKGRAASARKANEAIIKLQQTCRSHFDILAPDMVLNLLQLPVKRQDIFIRGLKFNSIFWSGFLSRINAILSDDKLNRSVFDRHIAFFNKSKSQITNPEISKKIEDRIDKKLAEMPQNRKIWGQIMKIKHGRTGDGSPF